MSAYPSTVRTITFDKLSNISGFDNAPAGTPYALVKTQEGVSYEPVVASAAVSIDPAGGLEQNASDQLRIKIDNTSGDSGLSLSTDGLEVVNRVRTAGDTMTGELEMGGNLVSGLPTTYPPLYSGDEATSWAQTVGLVSDAADTLVPLDGSEAMTGNLQMGGNRITGVADPVGTQDAATKNYVDTEDDLRVLKAGDTMTGELEMGGNLVSGLPTTYPPLYTGDEATSWTQTVGLVSDASDTLLALDGADTMTGNLQMGTNRIIDVVDPIDAQDAATKNYVDQAILNVSELAIELDVPILDDLGMALYPSLRLTTFDTADRVSAVKDLASGLEYVQTTQTDQPLLQFDVTINQRFLRFDGTDDFLEQLNVPSTTIAGTSLNTTTAYVVAKAYNIVNQVHFDWRTSGGVFRGHFIIPWGDGDFYVDYGTNASSRRLQVSGLPAVTGNLELWTFRTDGTTIDGYRGTASVTPIGTSTISSSLSAGTLDHTVAAEDGGSGRFMETDLYATYIYNVFHSDDQLHRMFTYFNEKYGV